MAFRTFFLLTLTSTQSVVKLRRNLENASSDQNQSAVELGNEQLFWTDYFNRN
jgi:hypothetical protein